jgi:hypothetical protein
MRIVKIIFDLFNFSVVLVNGKGGVGSAVEERQMPVDLVFNIDTHDQIFSQLLVVV